VGCCKFTYYGYHCKKHYDSEVDDQGNDISFLRLCMGTYGHVPLEELDTQVTQTLDIWECDVCAHVYDPVKDGGGVAFEDLPDTYQCPQRCRREW
jgi:rubredoxin